ncbi:MAG: hypothetical protein ACFFD8_05895 [Candidatus Thorarchaeota archaeon]
MRNKIPFFIGLIGGLLMISAGAIGGIGLWAYLPMIISILGLSPDLAYWVNLLLSILYWIAGFGGFAVIFGSALFVINRIGTGRFIVGLGAGMGIFTLILLFAGYYLAGIMPVAWPSILIASPGLLGAVLSVIARYMARSID